MMLSKAPQSSRWQRCGAGISLVLAALAVCGAEPAGVSVADQTLSLQDYLRTVWEKNENIQIRILEAAAADQRYQGEKRVFDPEWTAGFEAVDRRRPNTTEQSRSSFSTVFNERNRTYQTGLESLISSGAKLRLGYSVQHLENNYITQGGGLFGGGTPGAEHGEYLSTLGLTVTQPLLKNGGMRVTMAGIRAAAIQSDITFQQYRKGLMELLVRAEAAYWDLYQAQEQLAVSSESLRVAQTLLTDNKKRLEVGKGTELDVLQSEAGVATRLALHSEARQRLMDAQSRVTTFLALSWTVDQRPVRAVDAPRLHEKPQSFGELWPEVTVLNPDFAGAVKQAELEGIRVIVAKNQALPQLDLKAGYGASRVSNNAGTSMNLASRHDFPSWSAGLEFRMPLGSGKTRYERKAAELRAEATTLALDNLGTQLANALRAGLESVESYRANEPRHAKVVESNREVLKNQLTLLEGGKIDSRRVLEAEEDLFRARVTALENTVKYQRSMLDLEFLQGVVLQKRSLELTQNELRDRTAVLTRSGKITTERYEQFLQEMKAEYDRRVGTAKP